MSLVRVQHKGQMTIPSAVRSAVGLADGDLVDVKAARGKIILTPQVVMDRSAFPNATGEYTAEQRRLVDARLRAAEKTPLRGPFRDGKEISAYLTALKKAQPSAKSKPARSRSR